MKKMVVERSEFIGLKKGRDYEILTVSVFDLDCQWIPYGRFSKKNMMELVRKERFGHSIVEIANEESKGNSNVWSIEETRPLDEVQQEQDKKLFQKWSIYLKGGKQKKKLNEN